MIGRDLPPPAREAARRPVPTPMPDGDRERCRSSLHAHGAPSAPVGGGGLLGREAGRFDHAARVSGLDPAVTCALHCASRSLEVEIPLERDDGSLEIYPELAYRQLGGRVDRARVAAEGFGPWADGRPGSWPSAPDRVHHTHRNSHSPTCDCVWCTHGEGCEHAERRSPSKTDPEKRR